MRLLGTLGAAALGFSLALGVAAPATAHVDRDRLAQVRSDLLAEGEGTPVTSGNVQHVATKPGTTGISGCFMQTAPLFVTSGLESVQVWDVSQGTNPTQTGVLPNPVFENEAMNCGERRTKKGTKRFALVGIDLYQASPDDPQHVNVGGDELMIVDVTDPAKPTIRSRVASTSGTHTVACVEETDCRYAYSSGNRPRDGKPGTFSIFDLRRLDKPVEVDADPTQEGVQPFTSPTAGHKWNFDAAEFGAFTGFGGTSLFDVSNPREPRLVTTTGEAGQGKGAGEGYNDFIHHNSYRPNADAFRPDAPPSLENGNILLVTEEDYMETDCSLAGSFQTWHVKRLDGTPDAIVPLDKVELSDLQAQQPASLPLPHGTFCSAHWFDYHQSGIVAVGYYGGGSQLVDVSNPKKLTSHGYAYWGASEVWDTMWLPVYNKRGKQKDARTNVVYSIDLVRGLDVYSANVPGDGAGKTPQAGVDRERSVVERATQGVLPIGLVALALALVVAVRRRSRH
ncbi:hypothetical protein ACFP3Q_16115 [Nocardioides sp. GCM10027113]|uniref:hypothetical protein n=1 Tax=unclassified Nocardioides TaxID=2615069 RepID=UPI00360824CD